MIRAHHLSRRSFVNRRLGVLAVSVLAASMAVPSYAASHGTAVPHGQKRVCAAPSGRTAACHAHVVTNGRTGKPLASTSWTSGFGDDTLRGVYKPGGLTETVAVVDAYKNPNALND